MRTTFYGWNTRESVSYGVNRLRVWYAKYAAGERLCR